MQDENYLIAGPELITQAISRSRGRVATLKQILSRPQEGHVSRWNEEDLEAEQRIVQTLETLPGQVL